MALLSPSRSRVIPQPSAGIWPGLRTTPRAPVHAWIARGVTKAAVKGMPLTLRFPDNSTWGAGGPELQLLRPDAFFRRLGTHGLIGFGEAWMVGDVTTKGWLPGRLPRQPHLPQRPAGPLPQTLAQLANQATDELAAVLTVLARRMAVLVPAPLQRLRRLWQARQPVAEDNTPSGARENIQRHYDLSNELFETFLDPTMTYSAAWFEPDDDLETAQLRKIDGILDLARVGAGDRLLEIGSGWGALAIRAAAERGATVTTLTLSTEQQRLARQRIAAAGLSDRIEVRLEDYRVHAAAHPTAYDAVVSVEMIEAVGERYWPDYFGAVDRVLAPGGRMSLQAITMSHDRLLATRNGYTWVQKYIFPGGLLPSLTAIDEVLDRHTSLRVAETRRLGPSYVTTLEHWRHRFNDHLDRVAGLGFDDTFVRMWNFYLAYSQAGFAAGYIDDWQLGLARL